MLEQIRTFADSTNFSNAIKVTIASVIPVLVFSYFDMFEVGFAIAIGAFLVYPSDIPSNLKHKITGVLVGAVIVAGCNLFVNILHPLPWLLYPLTAILLFFLSMLSVYGHRANMVAFSGLLSVALAFGHLQSGWQIFTASALLFSGSIFYLLISLLFHFLRPHRYTELQMAECIRLTSRYLKLRGDLWSADINRARIIEKQLNLQVDLNGIHENIREILIRNRPDSGNSEQNRKMLLAFISLVEILELALSTSFDHNKIQQKFSRHKNILDTYQSLAYSLSSTLKSLAKSIENQRTHSPRRKLGLKMQKFEAAIREYKASDDSVAGNVWLLNNMLHYVEKQTEKIKVTERAFSTNPDLKALKGLDKDLEKFLTPLYYPLETLIDNLTFSSSFFRHSLRLTITILICFAIGWFFPLQNVYLILLTIVVIMRPGYGLTKSRSFQRIIGTIIGGLIAFAILSATQHPVLIGTLAVVSMILGFTFTSINYRVGVTFVTIYVVFLYGILTPDIENVIQYRMADTLIGGALAFFANYFLWPSWEFVSIPTFLKNTIEANRDYLAEISALYNKKGGVTTSYRVARKNAFVGVGNLMASYQRMVQEPKSKQRQIAQFYQLAVLNHTLLSASASLGTFIQTRETTTASETFNFAVDKILANLNASITVLNLGPADDVEVMSSDVADVSFTELKRIKDREILDTDPHFAHKMQEAHLIIEQLIWLTGLSEKIMKTSFELMKTR
ncbi:MAG: FUSC family protein [Flavobacterium sp.]|nr:FUSC family protein [Flavobacterium sp.]